MNRTPRNFGQSFSAAAVVGVAAVTEAVIIVVIVVVGVGVITAKGLLLKFPMGHDVMHIFIVTPDDIVSFMVLSQIVLFLISHVSCIKINKIATITKVEITCRKNKRL